jgi:hypothetical protein
MVPSGCRGRLSAIELAGTLLKGCRFPTRPKRSQARAFSLFLRGRQLTSNNLERVLKSRKTPQSVPRLQGYFVEYEKAPAYDQRIGDWPGSASITEKSPSVYRSMKARAW